MRKPRDKNINDINAICNS